MVIAEAPFVGEEIDIFTDGIVKVLKKTISPFFEVCAQISQNIFQKPRRAILNVRNLAEMSFVCCKIKLVYGDSKLRAK